MLEKRLEGKIAIITGGGRGIGAAAARLFAREGARVVIASRSDNELRSVVESIDKELDSGSAEAILTDVSREEDVVRLFQETQDRFGSLDILVNNAGAIAVSPIEEMTYGAWRHTLAVNLDGAFLCSREAFRYWKRTGKGGAIINISSLAGIKGTEKFPGFCAYTAAKHGVVGLTESLSVEGKALGVRVNCIAPGAVDTQMLCEAAPFLHTETKPEDIAKAILFLADENQSGKVTGAVIEIHSNA
ncbi:MAG: SDR family NAD(P)-dependent oxidoreductase [Candidatus Omnitrophota bacterium]